MKQKILPSVMGKSQEEITQIFDNLQGVVTKLHLDVADGKFVPNTSLWFPFKLSGDFKYNVHLMVSDPEKWVKEHGHRVDEMIFHPESLEEKEIADVISMIKEMRKKVGLALRPETTVSSVRKFILDLDYVLVLTVHPGFYGAKFLNVPLKKVNGIKEINPQVKVIVDGGMHPTTIAEAAKAGVDLYVSGSFVSKADDPKKAIEELEKAMG